MVTVNENGITRDFPVAGTNSDLLMLGRVGRHRPWLLDVMRSAPSRRSRPPMVHAADGGDRIRTINARARHRAARGLTPGRRPGWATATPSVAFVQFCMSGIQRWFTAVCRTSRVKVQTLPTRCASAPGAPVQLPRTTCGLRNEQVPCPRWAEGCESHGRLRAANRR